MVHHGVLDYQFLAIDKRLVCEHIAEIERGETTFI